jgi:hypothetical protein
MLKQPSLVPVPQENKYELVRDYEIQSEGFTIVIPKLFRYDGASIPAAAWQLTYSPFHPDVMLSSLVHDWIYYTHQTDQETADDIFYRLLRDNGVDYLRSNTMWAAVRSFGDRFWDNDPEDEDMLVRLCKKVRTRENFDRYHFPPHIIRRADA